jgi:hypothetical protein
MYPSRALSAKFPRRVLTRRALTLRQIIEKVAQGRDESVWSAVFALSTEAQRVILLRLAAVAHGGPSALPEIRLMAAEKMIALMQAAQMFSKGSSIHEVLLYYRSRVQANERRLSASMNPLLRATQKVMRRVPLVAKNRS